MYFAIKLKIMTHEKIRKSEIFIGTRSSWLDNNSADLFGSNLEKGSEIWDFVIFGMQKVSTYHYV